MPYEDTHLPCEVESPLRDLLPPLTVFGVVLKVLVDLYVVGLLSIISGSCTRSTCRRTSLSSPSRP